VRGTRRAAGDRWTGRLGRAVPEGARAGALRRRRPPRRAQEAAAADEEDEDDVEVEAEDELDEPEDDPLPLAAGSALRPAGMEPFDRESVR
jgi:hypothetical protein